MVTDNPTTLIEDLVFPEGPRWAFDRLWFSDIHGFKVMAVDIHGNSEIITSVKTRPSGLGWTPANELLIVSMEDSKLLKKSGNNLEIIADLSKYGAFYSNDMVVDKKGRAYIGHFGFDLYGNGERCSSTLLNVSPNGDVQVAADDLGFPNGAVITPDDKYLIIAETFNQRITIFDKLENGSLSNRRIWTQLDGIFPDGICLDSEGCLWIASPRQPSGCYRVSRSGEILDFISALNMSAFACMLGGNDRKTLFMCEAVDSKPGTISTGNGRIRIVDVNVPGAKFP
jgi:sugar lactone lactonase YvrE